MVADDEWDEARLGDLVQVKHGWPFKSEFFHEELTGRPIVVNIGNFRYTGGFRFGSTTAKEYRDDYPKEYELTPGDILLVMTCQTPGGEILGIPAKVPNDGRVYLHNQRLGKVVVIDHNKVASDYLYWLFVWSEFNRHLFTTASGTKILHTSPGRIESFCWRIPPLKEQEAIAGVLGSLEDKIELNRRMTEILEAMALTLFRSWFVNYHPVRSKPGRVQCKGFDLTTMAMWPKEFERTRIGNSPKGWAVAPMGEHIEAVKGLSYKGEGLADAGLPLHNLNSVYEGGGYKYEGIKFYTGDYKERHVLRPGDVIVANTEQGHNHLLIGYPAIVPKFFGETGLFSHHLYCVRPRPSSPLTNHFIYFQLMERRFRDEVTGHTNGTTVNMLAADGLQRPLFAVPPPELIQAFDRAVKPLFDKSEQLYRESLELGRVRDTLLPKLLSGEVRVVPTQGGRHG